MNEKQWEPLTTPEAVIEAIKAGRHVEFTIETGGWGKPRYLGLYDVRACMLMGMKYRALIQPEQGAYARPLAERHLPSDEAERIAARVPLPEPARPGDLGSPYPSARGSYWNEDQLRAAILAGVREAMRPCAVAFADTDPEALFIEDSAHLNCPTCGGSGHVDDAMRGGVAMPVATVVRINFTQSEATIKYTGDSAFPPFDVGHSVFTAPPASAPEVMGYQLSLSEANRLIAAHDEWIAEADSTGADWSGNAAKLEKLHALTAAMQEAPDHDRR